MNSRLENPRFLNPDETFERYEKRAHSPLHRSAGAVGYNLVAQNAEKNMNEEQEVYKAQQPEMAEFMVVEENKKKLPLKWIIAVAIAVPIFVILILFLAVWFQEMGLI